MFAWYETQFGGVGRVVDERRIAYWLETWTDSHVVWNEEDLARSYEALTRLASTPAFRRVRVSSICPMSRCSRSQLREVGEEAVGTLSHLK